MGEIQAELVTCCCNHCEGHLQFEIEHSGESVQCPHCGMDTRLYIPQAPQRNSLPPVGTTPTSPISRGGDLIFFERGGILVSKTRFVVPGQTFVLANITSVALREIPPRTGGGWTLIISGIIVALFSIVAVAYSALAIGVALMALGIWAVWIAKSTYVIMLSTAGGEIKSLTSTNLAEVSEVVAALNTAIIARG